MNAEKVLLLMEKYNACPNCGWKIKTDEDGNTMN